MSRPETIEEAREVWGSARPDMMAEAVPYYASDYSVYPETIRVSFRDGSTQIYELRVEQPHPIIMENVRIIRRMNGYVYQPPRRRNRK